MSSATPACLAAGLDGPCVGGGWCATLGRQRRALYFRPNVDAMTPAERVVSGEGIGGSGLALVCPAARIREFRFTSASDAV